MIPAVASVIPFALNYPPDKLGYIRPYPFEVVERRILIRIPQGDTLWDVAEHHLGDSFRLDTEGKT